MSDMFDAQPLSSPSKSSKPPCPSRSGRPSLHLPLPSHRPSQFPPSRHSSAAYAISPSSLGRFATASSSYWSLGSLSNSNVSGQPRQVGLPGQVRQSLVVNTPGRPGISRYTTRTPDAPAIHYSVYRPALLQPSDTTSAPAELAEPATPDSDSAYGADSLPARPAVFSPPLSDSSAISGTPRSPSPGDELAARPVLVLIHGAGHCEACYAHRWGPYLAQTHGCCVLAVSLRGHGLSRWEQPVSRARLAEYVADVRHVVADATVCGLLARRRDVILVGHSLGSLVALAYAEIYGVAGVVVVGGAASHLWMRTYSSVLRRFLTPQRLPRLLAFMRNPAAMFASEALVRELLLDHALPDGSVVSANDADVAACRAQLQLFESRAITRDLRALARRGPATLHTSQLLFVGGTYDVFFPPASIIASRDAYRMLGIEAQVVMLAGAHDLMLDSRDGIAERAADVVAAFAAQCLRS